MTTDHGDNRTRTHIFHQVWEEGFGAQISIMQLEQILRSLEREQGFVIMKSTQHEKMNTAYFQLIVPLIFYKIRCVTAQSFVSMSSHQLG